jgi:hypothetical protein
LLRGLLANVFQQTAIANGLHGQALLAASCIASLALI